MLVLLLYFICFFSVEANHKRAQLCFSVCMCVCGCMCVCLCMGVDQRDERQRWQRLIEIMKIISCLPFVLFRFLFFRFLAGWQLAAGSRQSPPCARHFRCIILMLLLCSHCCCCAYYLFLLLKFIRQHVSPEQRAFVCVAAAVCLPVRVYVCACVYAYACVCPLSCRADWSFTGNKRLCKCATLFCHLARTCSFSWLLIIFIARPCCCCCCWYTWSCILIKYARSTCHRYTYAHTHPHVVALHKMASQLTIIHCIFWGVYLC